jgi:hypothetical protein
MKRFVRTIIISGSIFFIDAFLFGQGGLAFITAVVVVIVLFPGIFIALLKRNKGLVRDRMIRVGIYSVMVAMVFLSVWLNNRHASYRAEELIQYCEKYKSKYEQYPDALEDLVPEFIPKVPRAKFSLSYGNFIYISRKNSHLLVYYAMPPFGRRLYSFESGRWGYLD